MPVYLVPQCQGCVKVRDKTCAVLTDPGKAWAGGQCWARSEDPLFWRKVYNDMRNYAGVVEKCNIGGDFDFVKKG